MLRKFKTLAATTCVAATAIVSIATKASAEALYTLSTGTSSDGGTISGSFDYDASQGYSNIAINTSGGNTTTFPPTQYTQLAIDNGRFGFRATSQFSQNGLPFVQLGYTSQPTGQPGDEQSVSAIEYNYSGSSYRFFSGVTITGVPASVPEPDGTSGIGLVLLGCGGWLVKRKMKHQILNG